jgi:hypothetical protein
MPVYSGLTGNGRLSEQFDERQRRLGREVRESAAARVHFVHFGAPRFVKWTKCTL